MTRSTLLLSYVACYVIWIVLSAATFLLLALVRTNILDFIYLLGARQAMAAFVDRLSIIPLVLVLIATIIGLEHSLRGSVATGRLWVRAGKAALILFGACALSYALHFAVVTIRLG